MGPYAAPALIQAGGQTVSAIGGGMQQRAMVEDERDYRATKSQEERDLMNRNVGTNLFLRAQPQTPYRPGG